MARKTKAEKQAEQEASMAALKAKEAAEYHTRLMKALEEATKEHYDLIVQDGQFKLMDYSSSDDRTYAYLFDPSYTVGSWLDLEELEYRLERLAEERAEANRLYKLKQEALAKLTDEEREVLGL